jgi:hypothetical protein
MEQIPFNCIVRLSILMDRNRAPREACHVVDTKSFGKALLEVQQVFKHLLGIKSIVTNGFKAPHPCAYPAGLIVGGVRLRH